MKQLFILLLSVFFIACEGGGSIEPPETGSGSSILDRWQITDADRPYNFNIEILDFYANDSIKILLDTDQDGEIDLIRNYGYQQKPHLGKDAIYLGIGTDNFLEWAYPTIINDTLILDMIRVDKPRISHYTKIE